MLVTLVTFTVYKLRYSRSWLSAHGAFVNIYIEMVFFIGRGAVKCLYKIVSINK